MHKKSRRYSDEHTANNFAGLLTTTQLLPSRKMSVLLAALSALLCMQAAVDGVPMQAYHSTAPQNVETQGQAAQLQPSCAVENRCKASPPVC